MHKVYEYSHLGGAEILQVQYPKIEKEINDVIAGIKNLGKSKVSKEKTMKGELLYSPLEINSRFSDLFHAKGYKELRDTYTIKFKDYPQQIPGAFKQVDFVKERVLVEVQFGKYAFMFYDMAKFQYFFNENKADVGIEIVPCHAMYRKLTTTTFPENLV